MGNSLSDQIGYREYVVNIIFLGVFCSIGIFTAWLLWYQNSLVTDGVVVVIRRTVTYLRLVIILELFLLLPLIYYCVVLGPPITLNVVTSYGNGDSWIYGYGRPIAGIILIGTGAFSEMHFFCRYICMIGCILQICFDSISCIQVYSYLQNVQSNSAPLAKYYSIQAYQFYVWRDIISIAICFLITLFMTYLFTLLGWGKQHIPFWQIAGGNLDRENIMRGQLTNRLTYTRVETSVPVPVLNTGIRKKKS